ncbi:uncharacterized protein yc1106_06791 [Curvularia clavata]|uniref:RRM domain-containing protein n=1 Tax=Curvularia clavata TaxID=95742 RepID=A0A9Q8ZCE8_CURCL|nr:uncharacterized protein yc1106_06791 [Curvularia clavata]
MALLPGSKASNERLVFVKNVPSYVPQEQIAKLFSPYHPISTKNIYKGSSITTIVIGFRSASDAARAQRTTDGKSLGNAVIKVEMYEQRRSIRYLRDHGHTNLPSEADEEVDETERPGKGFTPKEAPAHFPPLYPAPVKIPSTAPQGNTWARIASNQRAQGATNAPAITPADEERTPVSTPVATPRIPTAMPIKPFDVKHQTPDSSPPAAVSLGNATPDAIFIPPDIPPSPEDMRTETEIEYRIRRWGEILGWAQSSSSDVAQSMQSEPFEPLDTTARIQHRHARHCAFCMRREMA